jgi:hypothetical protein
MLQLTNRVLQLSNRNSQKLTTDASRFTIWISQKVPHNSNICHAAQSFSLPAFRLSAVLPFTS